MPEGPPTDLPSADEVAQQVARWVETSAEAPIDRDAERLDTLLRDPRGLEFALGVVDRVIRPEDDRVAATSLERLSRRLPQFLPRSLRAAVVAGGGFGVLVPRAVTPAVRGVFRRLVRHLVVDAAPKHLDRTLAELRDDDIRLDLHPIGEPALGPWQAAERRDAVVDLLAREDVDGVTVRLAAVAVPRSPWAFEASVDEQTELLAALLRRTADGRPTAITVEAVEHRELDVTLAAFTRALGLPGLTGRAAGIAIPTSHPDAVAAFDRLTAWARERVAAGGAGIRIRLLPGGDARLLRLVERALRPANADAVRVGLAFHDPFVLAFAALLAERRELSDRVVFEPRLGLGADLVDAVRATFGGATLAVPVVAADHFGDAVPLLVRRLRESVTLPRLDVGEPDRLAAAANRFAATLAAFDRPDDAPHGPDRSRPPVPQAPVPFVNDAPADPALAGNRAWARELLGRAAASTHGAQTLAAARVADAERVRELVGEAAAAGREWGSRPGSARAEVIDRAGEVLAAVRGRLVEALVAEAGATLAAADAEVGRTIDLTHHAAARARELAGIRSALFVSVPLTVVMPARSPALETAADALSALAAGSAVLLAPVDGASRVSAVLVEALHEAGIPGDVARLVAPADDPTLRALAVDPHVARALVGDVETARRVRGWRPDLPVVARGAGVNSIVVTPSADLDAAVRDLVASAFGGATRAAVGILVGSVADSATFRRRLADAVTSLTAGSALDPATQLAPLPEPATGAVTRLGDGEGWLVMPRALDGSDRLWSAGVREGVRPGAAFSGDPAVPVLSLVVVDSLDDAIALQNAAEHGPVAGLQALDPTEIGTWADRVTAASIVVNRAIPGLVVRRHPLGGLFGAGAAAGGPNTLLPMGMWAPEPLEPSEELRLDGLDPRVRATIEAMQPALDFGGFDRVRQGAYSDEEAWTVEYGRAHDPVALPLERNVVRYRPAEVVVRLSEGAPLADLARVLVAGVRARARMLVSSAVPLPSGMLPLVDDGTPLGRSPIGVLGTQVEGDEAFRARVARALPARIRLIGGDASALAHATGGSLDVAVWAGAVTVAGRLEVLPFVREQAVTMPAHRYGIPDREVAALHL